MKCWELRGCYEDAEMNGRCPHNIPGEPCPADCHFAACFRPTHVVCTDFGKLLDPSRDVARYGKLVPTGNPGVVSIEVRDPKRPEYGRITLIFMRDGSAPGGMELVSWVALDSQNKRTTIRLSNQRYGMAVADSTFTYRDPRRTGRRTG